MIAVVEETQGHVTVRAVGLCVEAPTVEDCDYTAVLDTAWRIIAGLRYAGHPIGTPLIVIDLDYRLPRLR